MTVKESENYRYHAISFLYVPPLTSPLRDQRLSMVCVSSSGNVVRVFFVSFFIAFMVMCFPKNQEITWGFSSAFGDVVMSSFCLFIARFRPLLVYYRPLVFKKLAVEFVHILANRVNVNARGFKAEAFPMMRAFCFIVPGGIYSDKTNEGVPPPPPIPLKEGENEQN